MSKSKAKQLVWECACGHIEHALEMPEDCSRCLAVGKFEKVPEDLWKDREEKEILSVSPADENDEDGEEYDED